MNKKLEDMIAESKLKEILHKNEAECGCMGTCNYWCDCRNRSHCICGIPFCDTGLSGRF